MQDPSNGISRELLPHVHLLSTYRFPLLPQLHPDKVAEWLLGAPKITRDQSPFYWTYLDRPVDGTIYLIWQTPALGNEFPSDGYTLEMYAHKTGYALGEPVATHSRRRYRLLPSKFPNHNGPSPDTSLWIVHYFPAEPNERVPINIIPVDMRVQNTLQTRAYLHSQGQIMQKEFMLHDRGNWPQIQFPRQQTRGNPMYGGNVPQARIPQAIAYPTQHSSAGPPAKRPRTQGATGQSAAANNAHAVLDIDDEEDTSRGDLFDHMTPREISLSRYKQNHEWMEEILSSPYAINQIIPADLGLGVRGELASLTEGFFDAPLDPEKDVAKHSYVGSLDPEKADAFRKRATERIAETNNEIEKMKVKHAKRMAKFQRGSLITQAEKELRTAITNPSDMGSDYWRLEGRIDEDENGDKIIPRIPSKVDDILAQVEASLGRHAVAVQGLRRIQDGGYEEAAPLPPTPPAIVPSPQKPVMQSDPQSALPSRNGTPQSGVLVGDSDMDMGNSAAGMLDQYRTGLSSDATPGSNSYTPQATALLQQHSRAGTPSNLNAASPQVPAAQANSAAADVNMSDAGEPITDANGTGDWVVVPPGGVSPTPDSLNTLPQQATTATASDLSPLPAISSTSTPQAALTATSTPQPVLPTSTADNTPLPDFSTSPNDFADLGDLDSAGDALASYDDGDGLGDLGDLGDMDVGMDDSAFGDAFHGVEPRNEDTGDGL
ncbi:swi snf and rsc complexes subunit ssr4 [Hyphodiscus hymeniophilus]|uniref:Swi snf and rsc complexes subunit ssr4 n=1 Tax=Hyphodiscus hymeniophilus TaxID=353542 RepID=A0A9P6VM70_9HELO|nr:swi snf and rsc complexes subunit ssr4 [Hyphodiscus hymeniophilus]